MGLGLVILVAFRVAVIVFFRHQDTGQNVQERYGTEAEQGSSNYQQPDDGGIDLQVTGQTSADAADSLVTFGTVQFFHN
ncbi:hypothetical protein D3C75_920380 [compost metagenome]